MAIIGNAYKDLFTGITGICESWTQHRTHVEASLAVLTDAGYQTITLPDWRLEDLGQAGSQPQLAQQTSAPQQPAPEPQQQQPAPEPEPPAAPPPSAPAGDPRLTDNKAMIDWCRGLADGHPAGLTPLRATLESFGVTKVPELTAEQKPAFIAAAEKAYQ
jgi:hypothetical protein